jgi:hypothetical protein
LYPQSLGTFGLVFDEIENFWVFNSYLLNFMPPLPQGSDFVFWSLKAVLVIFMHTSFTYFLFFSASSQRKFAFVHDREMLPDSTFQDSPLGQ